MVPNDPQNELAVDIGAEIQSLQADAATDAALEQQSAEQDAQADDLEVPDSDFWGDSKSSADQDQQSEQSSESSPSQGSRPGTITYKVDGKEVSIPVEEAIKKLSLADGARRAFSEKAKLAKELEQLKREREELAKYRESWDKLEDMRHDPEKLYELVFNKPYKDLEKEVYERKKLYEDATPEERQLLEYEARMRNLERDNERIRRDTERKAKESEEREFNAQRTQLQSQLEREFFKHKVVDDADPSVANSLKEMLWMKSVADLKKYDAKGYDVSSPKVISHVFKRNAEALKGFKSANVDKQVKAIVDAKKENARTKAQLASTSNYTPNKIDPKLTKLDPLKLFERMTGRR